MIKTFCDVCGEEIIEIYATSVPAIMPPPIGKPVSGVFSYRGWYGREDSYDLCGTCAKKLLDKIEKEDETK